MKFGSNSKWLVQNVNSNPAGLVLVLLGLPTITTTTGPEKKWAVGPGTERENCEWNCCNFSSKSTLVQICLCQSHKVHRANYDPMSTF